MNDSVGRNQGDETIGAAAPPPLLRDPAAMVEQQAAEIERLRRENERLRLALEHRALIEQAKGMVARDHAVSVEVAFEWLRRHSRNTNTPVRDLAAAVVEFGLHIPRPPAEPRRVIAVAQRRSTPASHRAR